jgi:hypothetical protein
VQRHTRDLIGLASTAALVAAMLLGSAEAVPHAHVETGVYDAYCPLEALGAIDQGVRADAPSTAPLAAVPASGGAPAVEGPVAPWHGPARLRAPPAR